MKTLYLDIETTRIPGMFWEPKPDRPNKLPPPPYWVTECVGLMSIERLENTTSVKLSTFSADDALTILRRGNAQIVTFNGRSFDIPILEWHAVKTGKPVPALFSKGMRGRFDMGHLDLLDWITNYGASDRISLDLACRSIGMVGKGNVSGDDVETMIKAGKRREVELYCLSDVAQLGILHTAVSVAAGWLTLDLAATVERAIWTACRDVEGLGWVLDCPRASRSLGEKAE